MGTYNNSPEEIADVMEEVELEGAIEGDFTEEVFLKGARLYIDRLRERGATINKK